ncbi:MAG: ParB family protein [Micromonosporaceae bacterium]
MPSEAVSREVTSAQDTGASPAGDGIDPAERTPRSFHLSRQLLERARAAAYWVAENSNSGEPTNVSELVERALRFEVERLEQRYNQGTPFPAVVGRMRTGPGASGVERIRRAQRARRRTRSD